MICTEVDGVKRVLFKIVFPAGLLAAWMMTCYPAVSYTHLDVYKRQGRLFLHLQVRLPEKSILRRKKQKKHMKEGSA